ncbi:MAG: VOC family protein [Chloroflexota bacterium]|nr:VOC family protein [Chloroflexota bacterium]
MIMPVLTVSNVNESMDYFSEKLGFTKHDAMKTPEGVIFFGFVGMGTDMLALGVELDGSGAVPANAGAGIDLMVYLPEGQTIDAHYEHVKAHGVEITHELRTEYWGDRVYSIKEPHGYLITFAQTIKQTSMEEAAATQGNTVVPKA